MNQTSQLPVHLNDVPMSKRRKIIRLINIFILTGLAFFVFFGAWSDVAENSKTFGLLLAISSQVIACMPILGLYFYIWRNKKMLTKVSTIFWTIGSIVLAIILFFIVFTLLFNTMLDTNFFNLYKLPKF
jgi:uncharacterized membrane-anchored protein